MKFSFDALDGLYGADRPRAQLGTDGQADAQAVLNRLNARLASDEEQLALPEQAEVIISQKSLSRRMAITSAREYREASDPFGKARVYAYAAPGCSRWLEATPTQTLDQLLTSCEVVTSISLQLGVDVYGCEGLSKFCGMVMDRKGLHALACTAGGDCIFRDNQIRDIIHSFCMRGQLNPELQKAGLLQDESVMVNLRRPADVLIDRTGSAASGEREWDRIALDVKVINALGSSHFDASISDGLAAAESYRQEQIDHLNTGALCAAQNVSYQPLVFTCQGGCERHAEAILSRIASAVAECESVSTMEIKADLMQEISLSLVRSASKAVERRRPRHQAAA